MIEESKDMVRKELEELSPTLAELKRGKAFSVPSGYFDSLEESILSNAKRTSAPIPVRRLHPARILAYAASFLLMVGMAWAAYNYIIEPLILKKQDNSNPQSSQKKEKGIDRNQPESGPVDAITPLDVIEPGQLSQSITQGTANPEARPESGAPSGTAPDQINGGTSTVPGSPAFASAQQVLPLSSSAAPVRIRDSSYCKGEIAYFAIADVQKAANYKLYIDGRNMASSATAGKFKVGTDELPLGTHKVEIAALDAAGLELRRESATMRVLEVPSVDLGMDACSDQTYIIDLPLTRNTAFLWQDGSTAPAFTARQSGTYWVTLSNKELPRCKGSDTIRLKILPPPADQLPEQISICNSEDLRLSVRNPKSDYLYSWLPNNKEGSTLFIKGLSPGTYTYSLLTQGCTETYREDVQINVDDCGLSIPNVITPNGDGANDMFVIANLEKHPQTYLTIFDRSGNKVFESNDYQNNWDASNCPSGTYYFILRMKKSPVTEKSGTITVVR